MPKKSARKAPQIDWSNPQHDWDFPLRIPVNKSRPGGPTIEAHARLLSVVSQPAIQANEFIAFSYDIMDRVKWCDDFDRLLCGFDVDGATLVARRKATAKDLKRLRYPMFIQSEEWPLCCGRSMQFVGQLDDNFICTAPPPEAKLWWHDAASFYVFTCSQCLECKAIGQQF